jgi:ribonuclease P protein component
MVVQCSAAAVLKAAPSSSRKPLKFLKKYRLSSKRDFQSVFDKPTKISSKYFLMLYRASELPYARLGIIINKSHAPKAVDRNRMRRIVRESFREQMNSLQAIDIIIFIRSKWSKDKLEFRNDVEQLWQKLK